MLKARNAVVRTITQEDFPQLFAAFNSVFGKNQLPYWQSREELLNRFKKLGLSLSLSAGAFVDKKMIGFVLTGLQDGIAYNTGTGVVEEYRNCGIARKMYTFLMGKFLKLPLQRCLLEVEVDNQFAINLYLSLGFFETRKLTSFRLAKTLPSRSWAKDFHLFTTDSPNLQTYKTFSSIKPSFIQSWPIIKRGMSTDSAIEVYYRSALVGAGIFSPGSGQVHFIGVLEGFRSKNVGYQLLRTIQGLCYRQKLVILNVPEQETSMIDFLRYCGFVSVLQQIEMVKQLN
jgi:ribosomal protein S18 acetylase RimI-like enzyme